MYWKDLEEEFWDKLASRKTKSHLMVVTEELVNNSPEDNFLSIFISQDGSYHFILSIPQNNKQELVDPKVAGIKTGYLVNHLVTGRERQDYIDIQCTAKPHLPAFTSVIKDISKLIFEENFDTYDAIDLTIKRWRSFWGSLKDQLSESEQLGLYGELVILKFLLENNILNSINTWVGPDKAIHDFEFQKMSIEIKTTLKIRHEHIIHGLEQLSKLNFKNLFLISIKAFKDEIDGMSITDLINEIADVLIDRPEEYEIFMKKLSAYGYHPDYENEHKYLKFSITDIRLYPVDNNFPKLTSDSLKFPLPANIADITYKLNIEGMEFMHLNRLFSICNQGN